MTNSLILPPVLVLSQPTEADRIDEENRKKKLSTFTHALGAFISGGEEQISAPELPAPISNDLLAGAGMQSPTQVTSTQGVSPTAGPAPGTGAAEVSRAKPPAGAPPPPGSAPLRAGSAQKMASGRPPPPTSLPAPPGTGSNLPNLGRPAPLNATSGGIGGVGSSQQLPRSNSMSPPSSGPLSRVVAIGAAHLEGREGRSASADLSGDSKGPLPEGAHTLMEMGFSEKQARTAVERTGGNVQKAAEWILAKQASKMEGSTDEGEEELRPPSPSTGSPQTRKSLVKKPKPGTPQNPVFDQNAFTPCLIPAKNQQPPALGAQPFPNAVAGRRGRPGSSTAPLGSPPLPLAPGAIGIGQREGPPAWGQRQGQGQEGRLIRPRSTPDVISALDPESVENFELEPVPMKQTRESPMPPGPAGTRPIPGGGMGGRRQSEPSVLSPNKIPPGISSMPPRVMPSQRPQFGQVQQRSPITSGPVPPQLHPQGPQQQTQQQKFQVIPGQNADPNTRRPPPPAGPAAVGGAVPGSLVRAPVPRGAAPVGGGTNIMRTMLAPGVGRSAGVGKPAPRNDGGPPRPTFPQQQGPVMAPQVRPAMPGQTRGRQQAALGTGARSTAIPPSSIPSSAGIQNTVNQFVRPPQSQQFVAQNTGHGIMSASQARGVPTMNAGQQQMPRATGLPGGGSQQLGPVSEENHYFPVLPSVLELSCADPSWMRTR